MAGIILIIESCKAAKRTLGRIFEESFEVLLVANAFEGLKMLSEDVGVVLLDYVLPDANGIDVLKEIKTRHPSIPVIMITGHGSEEECQQSFKSGAIDYINYKKYPFETGEINTKVDLLLNLRSRELACRRPLFLESLSVGYEEAPPAIPSPILDGIMRAKKYIDEHFTADIHISHMVKEAAMNKTYFCNYFKLVTGHTFKDYITCKRLRMAKDLLSNQKLRVDQVADRVGYSSKHFYEIFKKSFGIPPKRNKKSEIDKSGVLLDKMR